MGNQQIGEVINLREVSVRGAERCKEEEEELKASLEQHSEAPPAATTTGACFGVTIGLGAAGSLFVLRSTHQQRQLSLAGRFVTKVGFHLASSSPFS